MPKVLMKMVSLKLQCGFCKKEFEIKPAYSLGSKKNPYYKMFRGKCKCGAEADYAVEMDNIGHPPGGMRRGSDDQTRTRGGVILCRCG